MMNESIMAVMTTISLLAAITAWSFAWKINSQWTDYAKRMLRVLEELNTEWNALYQQRIKEDEHGK